MATVSGPDQHAQEICVCCAEYRPASCSFGAAGGAETWHNITHDTAAMAVEIGGTDVDPNREVAGCYHCIPVREEESVPITRARSNAELAAKTFLAS